MHAHKSHVWSLDDVVLLQPEIALHLSEHIGGVGPEWWINCLIKFHKLLRRSTFLLDVSPELRPECQGLQTLFTILLVILPIALHLVPHEVLASCR